jgi:hypothetical protein
MKAGMKPRERVMAALNLQEPDRVPIDLAQACGDGITVTAYRNLINYLGMPERPIRILTKLAQTALVDEDVLHRFHVDFRRVDLVPPDGWRDEPVGEDGYRDEWGVVRTRPKGGFYYDLIHSPIKEGTMTAIERHPWPDPTIPAAIAVSVSEPVSYTKKRILLLSSNSTAHFFCAAQSCAGGKIFLWTWPAIPTSRAL